MTGINAMNRFMRKLFRFIPLEQVMPVENVCADFPVHWGFLKFRRFIHNFCRKL